MNESNSRRSLFEPGEADDFFQIADLPRFDPESRAAYCRGNALWLAEFSRLVYRDDTRSTRHGAAFKTREAVLLEHPTGWREAGGTLPRGANARVALFLNQTWGCAALVFRGTLGLLDLVGDSMCLAVRWRGHGHVHLGFKLALDAVWNPVEAWLGGLDVPVFFAGHSLGGALATLAAARCCSDTGLVQPRSLYTFGSPRVGDAAFCDSLGGLFHCRMVNGRDLVATLPPAFSLPRLPVYRHSGQLHRLGPAGRLEVATVESDTAEPPGSPAALARFAASTRELLARASLPGRALPQALLDHAPVNYVARLEQGGRLVVRGS